MLDKKNGGYVSVEVMIYKLMIGYTCCYFTVLTCVTSVM